MKKYNNQTGCYKIDIYINGSYSCSTDKAKTCKAAIKRFLELHPNTDKVKAFFYKS